MFGKKTEEKRDTMAALVSGSRAGFLSRPLQHVQRQKERASQNVHPENAKRKSKQKYSLERSSPRYKYEGFFNIVFVSLFFFISK